MGDFVCPKCCKRTMQKKKIDHKYYLVCNVCGTKRGPLSQE